jgi:four helix bundle protein
MSSRYEGERRGFAGLEVWQLGRKLVVKVYEVSAAFPASEQFGLTAQVRRAAVSVPCNIAEGWGRNADGDFVRFLRIARGSLNEVETLVVLAKDLGLSKSEDTEEAEELVSQLERKLFNLTQRIQQGIVREPAATYGATCADSSSESDYANYPPDPDSPDNPDNSHTLTSHRKLRS